MLARAGRVDAVVQSTDKNFMVGACTVYKNIYNIQYIQEYIQYTIYTRIYKNFMVRACTIRNGTHMHTAGCHALHTHTHARAHAHAHTHTHAHCGVSCIVNKHRY